MDILLHSGCWVIGVGLWQGDKARKSAKVSNQKMVAAATLEVHAQKTRNRAEKADAAAAAEVRQKLSYVHPCIP